MPPVVNITLSIRRTFAWLNANRAEDSARRANILAHFWSFVKRAKANECWPFLGPVYSHGYGVFHFGRERNRAHRLSWMLSRGPIPDGLVVCHSCDNKLCVNPSHLFLGTQAENIHDSVQKGRKRAWGLQKLNAAHVRAIRARVAAGEPQKAVAADFGISRNHVSSIVNRACWAHVDECASGVVHHAAHCGAPALASEAYKN